MLKEAKYPKKLFEVEVGFSFFSNSSISALSKMSVSTNIKERVTQSTHFSGFYLQRISLFRTEITTSRE